MKRIINRGAWGFVKLTLEDCKYVPLFLIGRAPSYQDEYGDYDEPIYAGSMMCFILLWLGLTLIFYEMYPESINNLIVGNMPSLSSSFAVGLMSMVIYLIASYLLVKLIMAPSEFLNARERNPRRDLDKSVPPSF